MPRKLLALFIVLILGATNVFAAKIINLPKPSKSGMVSLEQSIASRRSERKYRTNKLTNDQLSQILWAAQGITDQGFGFRAAPSAGALYPLKIYVIKEDGVFRYLPDGHRLMQLSEEDKRPSLLRASLGQDFIREAPVSIVVSANFSITQAKYGARAFRYVCMEIGHVAENIHLQAVALGLGSIPVGAFWDDVIKKVLELPEEEDPLYIIPIGYAKK